MTNVGDMIPGEEREQGEWEEVLNYPSVAPCINVQRTQVRRGGARRSQGIKRARMSSIPGS